MKLMLVITAILISVKLIFFYPAEPIVKTKLNLIKWEIKKQGYKTSWFIISEKRTRWYNRILSNSVDNSNHLRGMAIDIFVLDINGNGKYDSEDIRIFKEANLKIEQKYPHLSGAIGIYTKKGRLTKHMIHVDVRGKKTSYNY